MENEIIKLYIKKREEAEQAENKMKSHFDKIVERMLADFISIKERLRVMPDCVGKVMLFRKIIMTEDSVLINN
jgi:hypothetical protein